jgi:hypothetical protein
MPFSTKHSASKEKAVLQPPFAHSFFGSMERPSFLAFTAVPVRGRRDGWDEARQRRFVIQLARGLGVREAAASVGMSRQTAYALRSRAGAADFARAWDEAVEFAQKRRTLPPALSSPALIEGVERLLVPRFYRGRLVGFVERDDVKSAMRQLRQLDRMIGAETDKADTIDVPRRQSCQFP